MSFDGTTVFALICELKCLEGGRVNKIIQPEKDEIDLIIKTQSGEKRLLLSANPSLPLAYIATNPKITAPLNAPTFCMLLRKHLSSSKILKISGSGFERIINIDFEHYDEMGDLCIKRIVLELMGKYSNIIFTDKSGRILDSIKHVNALMSSVREVLPGLSYIAPSLGNKISLLRDGTLISREEICNVLKTFNMPVFKAIYSAFIGMSSSFSAHVTAVSGIDGDMYANSFSDDILLHLSGIIRNTLDGIVNGNFTPSIEYESDMPKDFSVFSLSGEKCESVSDMIETFYEKRSKKIRINEKSMQLKSIVNMLLERNYKKYELQSSQLKDTDKKEKFMLYGELLKAYAFSLPSGEEKAVVLNYYTNEEITIPLDINLSAMENSQKYYAKYSKLKRTQEALTVQLEKTNHEIMHLESIKTAIEIAQTSDDLLQIKEEMIEYSYMKPAFSKGKKQVKSKSVPMRFTSSDGFEILVGKNNIQNEEITFKIASGNDIWFHAKNMPGSHVILKTGGLSLMDIPDRTIEEAACLAAHFCKGSDQEKVEVDYVERKQVKKVAGAPIGFVIYHTNYSLIASTKLPEVFVS